MPYADLTRRQKAAIKTYQKQQEEGFEIADRYVHYPNDSPKEGCYIEELITTPWYFKDKSVEAYADVNIFINDGECETLQFLVDGSPVQTYSDINGELKFQGGELTDTEHHPVRTDDAVSMIEDIARNGVDLLSVPFYREFMIGESYLSGCRGEPIPTEQDYIDTLAGWGDNLTDSAITMCGSVTDVSELHIACESSPHFNNGKGGHGLKIPDKLKKYLEMGNQSRAKQAEDTFGNQSINETTNKTDIDFGD